MVEGGRLIIPTSFVSNIILSISSLLESSMDDYVTEIHIHGKRSLKRNNSRRSLVFKPFKAQEFFTMTKTSLKYSIVLQFFKQLLLAELLLVLKYKSKLCQSNLISC